MKGIYRNSELGIRVRHFTVRLWLPVLASLLLLALACSDPAEPAVAPELSVVTTPTPVPSVPALVATPEPTVAATPAPAVSTPTAVPEPAAASTSTPTPEPPTATPAPELPDGYAALTDSEYLEETNREAAESIRSLFWVADGVTDAEKYATEILLLFAIDGESLFWSLTDTPWLESGNTQQLDKALESLAILSELDLEVAEDVLLMPFLDTLEPLDLVALESLSRLSDDEDAFWQVIDHPVVSDGIDDEEAKIVALLGGVNENNPDLVATLLDFSLITMEQRVIDLPLAGPVTLAIIRTGPGAARSMDILEDSVRNIEDFMGEPFPQRYVALLFESLSEDFTDGTNDGTYMAIRADYDTNEVSDELDSTPGMIIAHEVAHYYWFNGRSWLVEGAAEFTAAMSEAVRVDRQPDLTAFPPCSFVSTISELEDEDYGPEAPINECNYSLGSRLFLDLYFNLDDTDFWESFSDLYLIAKAAPIEEDNPDKGTGIEELRDAFEENADRDTVEVVTARWYEGTEPYDTYYLDDSPVTPTLPGINGQIDQAYLVLGQGDELVVNLSAADALDGVWLVLEYSYDYAGPPLELPLEIVEYYEDGFPHRSETVTFQTDPNYIGDFQSLAVGPDLEQDWAPGLHWVYVYHEGVKVAEVQYEFIP